VWFLFLWELVIYFTTSWGRSRFLESLLCSGLPWTRGWRLYVKNDKICHNVVILLILIFLFNLLLFTFQSLQIGSLCTLNFLAAFSRRNNVKYKIPSASILLPEDWNHLQQHSIIGLRTWSDYSRKPYPGKWNCI
jgi:hypothetical protein